MLKESEYSSRKGVATINDAKVLLKQLTSQRSTQEIRRFLRGKSGMLRVIIVGEIEKSGAVVFRTGEKVVSLMPRFFSKIQWN